MKGDKTMNKGLTFISYTLALTIITIKKQRGEYL